MKKNVFLLIILILSSCNKTQDDNIKKVINNNSTGEIISTTNTGYIEPELNNNKDKTSPQDYIYKHYKDLSEGNFELAYSHFSQKYINEKINSRPNGMYSSLEKYKNSYEKGTKFEISDFNIVGDLKYLFTVSVNYPDGTNDKYSIEIILLELNGEYYIESLKSTPINNECSYKISNYINPEFIGDIFKEKAKDYIGKNRIIEFKTTYNCGGKTITDISKIYGKSGKIDLIDLFAGFPAFGSEGESINVESKKLNKGDVSIEKYSGNNSYRISGSANSKKFEGIILMSNKKTLEEANIAFNDIEYIINSIKIYTENTNTQINWNNIDQVFFGENNNITVLFKDGIKNDINIIGESILNNCNSPNEITSVGAFCTFKKYDSKTKSIIIDVLIARNFGQPSEDIEYSINIENGKIKEISHKCTDGTSEKCQ